MEVNNVPSETMPLPGLSGDMAISKQDPEAAPCESRMLLPEPKKRKTAVGAPKDPQEPKAPKPVTGIRKPSKKPTSAAAEDSDSAPPIVSIPIIPRQQLPMQVNNVPSETMPLSGLPGDIAISKQDPEAAPLCESSMLLPEPKKRKMAAGAPKDPQEPKAPKPVTGIGKPSKKPTTAAAEDAKSPAEVLAAWVTRTQQPFVTQGAVDALGGKIKKPMMQSLVDSMLADGKLKVKEFKKTVVYYPTWEAEKEELPPAHEGPDGEAVDMAALRQEHGRVTQDVKQLESSVRHTQMETAKVASLPSRMQLVERVNQGEGELKRLREAVSALSTTALGVAPEEYKKTVAEYAVLRKLWVQRRMLVSDAIARIASDMKSPQEVIDDLGLETDEACGVSLANFPGR